MGRKKITPEAKNQIISASILPHQKTFIEHNPNFDFSKFIQIHLGEYINLHNECERIKRGLKK